MLIPWPKVACVPCLTIVTNQEMYILYVLSSTVTNVCVAKEIAQAKCLKIFEVASVVIAAPDRLLIKQ